MLCVCVCVCVCVSGAGDVLLVDGLQLLVEEKEVGLEELPGAEDLLPSSDPQVNLEKGLTTSEILKCEYCICNLHTHTQWNPSIRTPLS